MPDDRQEIFDEFIDDVLSEPEGDEEPATPAPRRPRNARSIPVVSAPLFVRQGYRMDRMLPAVTAVRVIGSGMLQDLSKFGRDLVGGRAGTVESTLAKHLEEMRVEIAAKAFSQGAGAVVSYRIEVGTYGESLTILVSTGTPVLISLQDRAEDA